MIHQLTFARLNHVGITVPDLNASASWYVEKLGFTRSYAYEMQGGRACFVNQGDFRIEFFQLSGATAFDPARSDVSANARIGGLHHFALEVEDVAAAIDTLRTSGVDIAKEPDETPGGRGERYAFIRDNVGMLIELTQPVREIGS